jgi:glycosyltransferase involved in cell wall biosynthesis
MIVRNEARIIRRSLKSVADYIACWVIGDTGSTDETPAIIEDFFRERGIPGELYHFPFENFEQARNEALRRARESALTFDYILLIDADMELQVSDAFFRDRLTAPAYSVSQHNSISYWNDRLVRRDTVARYRGVTHEYMEVPAGRERLHGIRFVDHAEGSSRAEKYERDTRLLRENLERDPNNVRSWFYLGQTYRDSRQWAEAVKAYQRRVELGGWSEEAWYAQLQVARCMLHQGNENGFVRNALAAWNLRPHRAEPLYDLARFHRDRGENVPATLFAVQGMRIPWPKDDSLFIEDSTYSWGLKEEYAISGYYVPEHIERAATVCDALALSPKVPARVRNQARRNLRFYARPLQELLPSFRPERVCFDPHPGWHAMNPCVLRWNNELWMLQRTVNYIMTAGGDYVTDGDEPVRTRNFLLRLDQSFAVLHAAELPLPADLPPPVFGRVLGFEDIRIFVRNDALWGTATVREQNKDGWCETTLFRIEGAGTDTPRIADWRVIRPAGDQPRHEKNWMAVASGKDLRFIYSVAPTLIVDDRARVLMQRPAPWAADQLRGGSQAIPFGPGWLALCHEHVSFGKARFYLHRFVWLDRSGVLRRISPPFNLIRTGIEFVAGLAWHPDGKRLVISFGVADAESWIGCVQAADLPKLLTHSAPVADAAAGATTTAKLDVVPPSPDAAAAEHKYMPSPIAAGRSPNWMIGNVTYWRREDSLQNLGDFLSELFVQRIAAAPLTRYARLRLVGSVLSDFVIRTDLQAGQAGADGRVGYWGCGLRDDEPIDAALRHRFRCHGVRGPLTRDILGLPADTPLGDPGLLVPLLHAVRTVPGMAEQTICVPHINDGSSDRRLLARTGAHAVIRAAVPRSLEALLETIDTIASAEFVLAGALHAAIIAAAYGRPFAYYDSGAIDLPFKWRDFAASVGVPVVFVPTVSEGRCVWRTEIEPALRLPPLAPLLAVFPGEVRGGLLEAAWAWDAAAKRSSADDDAIGMHSGDHVGQ